MYRCNISFCFPSLHRFHPLNFSLCQCIPLAKSSEAVRHSQLSTQQLIISALGVQQLVLYENTPCQTRAQFWRKKTEAFSDCDLLPPSCTSTALINLLPLVAEFTVKTRAVTIVFLSSCASWSSHPAAQTSRQTCHGCRVSFSLPLLVKTVTCACCS